MRCLADLAIVDAAAPTSTFAEKLGLWIHFTDAITLSAVLNDSRTGVPASSETVSDPTSIDSEFTRVQAGLIESITRSCSSASGTSNTHIKLPAPARDLPLDLATAYAPYRRFYEAHQREMELRLQPLRVNVREALEKASPQLTQLADLDAVFEQILRDREKQLLATVPLLLKQRFAHLFTAHQQWLAERQLPDNPAGWTNAGGWLVRFCDDLRMLLLAELALRLQPALGLIEAFNEHLLRTHTTHNIHKARNE
ncbi:hypothetical protein GCM10022212_08380 [Actimicrobium antarcticum]|uniref:DUF3348 domain-containing protein n=2 Tax=Actimicrobium antarcticum TaxID=1051899 RepID=A0ABP7SSR0_9BURK